MAIQFSMQDGTLKLGRYAGAPIHLHMSFFFTAVLLTLPFWRFGARSLILVPLAIAIIFASILVHELAHAEVARRYRLPATRIDIHMFGGLVQFPWLPHTRSQDFAITLAGPMSNLAIGVVALGLFAIVPDAERQFIQLGNQYVPGPPMHGLLEQILRATAYLNLGLCVVNLIPAFPLDGGKLLHLVIEGRWNSNLATLIVSALGLVFACLSTFVLIGTALSGMPIWAPPEFGINWRAFQAARQGRGGWDVYAY